jgi:predicted O-methyltransferase YrrM
MGALHRSLGLHALRIEGYLSREQAGWFTEILGANPEVTRVIEIGFNAGDSSCVFLGARDDITVVSFDLGRHGYVTRAKQYIDQVFPGRHTLVLGDSRQTVPGYLARHPGAKFDLAFIDGGHDYDVASADVSNVLPVVRPEGLVVMDDLEPWKTWGSGPVRAWAEAVQRGAVKEIALLQEGRVVTAVRRKVVTSAWALGCLPG